MYYKKLSLSQINYTEDDRLSLIRAYDTTARINGYGVGLLKDSHTPSYILSLYKKFNFFADNFFIMKTRQCSETLDTPARHIHIDNRHTALNIPIYGCTAGCATAFFSEKNLRRISLPVPNSSISLIKQGDPEELGRFYLEMDSAYLLDTTVPHAKIQIAPEPRMLLSMAITIPFAEALEYFK